MQDQPKNPAEKLALRPIRFIVSAVAIALMFSLATNSVVRGVYALHAEYSSIILNQQEQLAAVAGAGKSAERSAEQDPKAQDPKETNRIIVKYKEKDLPPGLAVAAERANLEKAQGLRELLTISGINAVVYEVSAEDTAGEVVDRILNSKKDMIEYAEVDMLIAPTFTPNDQYYSSAWHLPKIGAPTAWGSTTGEGVTIAVLDTGVDYNHPDLAISAIPPWNFYDNNADITDIHGHGTLVAGAAGAIGGNTIGVVGSAPMAKILGVRIAQPDAWASHSTMAQGIVYAADKGARVANLSYANSCSSATIINAANYLRSKGGVLVVAAGNTGADNGLVATDATTCVSATDGNDNRTSWSSYGVSIDLSAPGAGIYTTSRGGGYTPASGTSLSAPVVAGIYALMFSANPALTPTQADSILYSTADDIGTAGWDMYYGHGRVNAAKAVAAAKAAVGTRDITAPSAPANLKTTSVTANSVSLTWSPATDDNSGIAGYSIYRNGTKLATIAGTSYTSTGLTSLTTYSYTVKAEDVAGNVSVDSNTLNVTTPDVAFGISSYSVPTKTATDATVTANLTKPGTVVVKYGTSAASLTQTAQSATAATTHTVSLTGLTAFTTYYYQVVATDASGKTVTSVVSSFKTNKASGGGKPRR